MKRFFIRISMEAETDIDDIFRYIYRKMTVVFNVMDDIVLVRRVMAGSLIL